MPDKSCRTCGGELVKWSTCPDCRKITQKICKACSCKTIKEQHLHHIHLEPYLANKQERLATVQSFSSIQEPKITRSKKHTRTTIAISILVAGILVLGISITNYAEFSPRFAPTESKPLPQSVTPEPHAITDTPSTTIQEKPVQNIQAETIQPTSPIFTYNNCLGVSDGVQLTVTCPTQFGIQYKAVVKIPTDLIIQLESDVFKLRELSVTEHSDSISIQYAKKMYEAKFING